MDKRKSDIMMEYENRIMIADYMQPDMEGMRKRLDAYKQIVEDAKEDKDGEGNQI